MRTWIDVIEDLSFFNCQMFAGEVVVVEVPPPRPESQCTQDSEEANPPGLVNCEGKQQDELADDVSVAAIDFE